MNLRILYQDRYMVAVDKPPDILVHRSALSRDRVFLLQQLRDQLGRTLFPAHRLDRATSGILLFALEAEVARQLMTAFAERRVEKHYLAVVRGWPDALGQIERPVREDRNQAHREAESRYRRLATMELPVANRRYPTSRYSLLDLEPLSGRRHQLRIHMERISHPIIGDTTHGDGEHNRIFRQHFGIRRLMLHAQRLCIEHPASGRQLELTAAPRGDFMRLLDRFDWAQAVPPT
jgi:tRNA pseudouridine65 synthase